MAVADSVALARRVLEADGNPFLTLSLAPDMAPVAANTPLADARRSYMRLAALIHPDKLKGSFDQATEAFQSLVRSFEVFADPKTRVVAARRATSTKAKRSPATRKSARPVEKKCTKVSGVTSTAAPRKKARKGTVAISDEDDFVDDASASSLESEAEDTASDSDSGDETEVDARGPPAVSTSRAPIGVARTGPLYKETTVGCPNCRTRWEPDAKTQYSLFMGPWGRQVHCQLCLLYFGSATALHSCPYCAKNFDYDASMYENVTKCRHCKQSFGFPYYPVNQMLVDQVALDVWKANEERRTASERAARAKRRGATEPVDKVMSLLGQCITDERCPLCSKLVRSRHRAHIEDCLRKKSA